MFRSFLILALILTASISWAQDTSGDAKAWTHESEMALVTTTGNSENESTSAKQKTSYTHESNIFTGTARYLRSKSGATETARNWDAGLRYERTLSEQWGVFVAHLVESDPYSGYIQRDSSDLGAKYSIVKTEEKKWLIEAGARYSDTYTVTGEHDRAGFGRLYSEYAQDLNESVSIKFWAEYLPNFKNRRAYLANSEASITTLLTQVFSLKVAYHAKYQNEPASEQAKRTDTVFTTSLVAKF